MDFKYGDVMPDDYQPDFGDTTPEPEAPAAPENGSAAAEPAAPPPAAAPKQQMPNFNYGDEMPEDYQPDFGEDTTTAPAAPAAAEKPGYLSNLARGIGERGGQLVGATAGVIANTAEAGGDWMDQNIGRPVWDQSGLGWKTATPEEAAGDNSWITKKLHEVEAGLKDPDLGYDPRTTWEDVKNAPLRNVVPFAVEQGLVSLPDMIAAIKNAPAYIAEQAQEIGRERAKNEARDLQFGDIVKSLPAAVVSQWMEKLGTEKILGRFAGGEAVLSELKQLPAELFKTLITEGATEAAQQAAQYTGGHAFTQKGMDWWQMAEEIGQAGIVGMIFGPAARAPIAGLEIATSKGKAEEQTPPGVPVADPEQENGQPTPGGTGETPPPPTGAPATKTEQAPTNDGIVEQVLPGTVSPDIAATADESQVAPASTDQPAVTGVETDEEIVDDDEDFDYVPGESPNRVVEKKAATTVVAPAGLDTAAALEADQAITEKPTDQAGAPEAGPLATEAVPTEPPVVPPVAAAAPVQAAAPAAQGGPSAETAPTVSTGDVLRTPDEVIDEAELGPPVEDLRTVEATQTPIEGETLVQGQPEPQEQGFVQQEPVDDIGFGDLATKVAQEEMAKPEPEIIPPKKGRKRVAKAAEQIEGAVVEAQPIGPAGRQLRDAIHQELAGEDWAKDPRFAEHADKVAREMTSDLPKKTAPAAFAREKAKEATARAKKSFAQTLHQAIAEKEQKAAEEPQKNVEAIEASKERAKEARKTGAPQELARTTPSGKKAAEHMEVEKESAILRAAKKNREKPEAERDEMLDFWLEDYEARSKIRGPDHTEIEFEDETMTKGQAREKLKNRMAKYQEVRVKRQREKEVTEPPKQIGQRETTPPKVAHDKRTTEIVSSTAGKLPSAVNATSYPPAILKRWVAQMKSALKEAGIVLPETLSKHNTPEENLAIYASGVLDGKYKGNAVDILVAKMLYDAKQYDAMYESMQSDLSKESFGSSLETADKVLFGSGRKPPAKPALLEEESEQEQQKEPEKYHVFTSDGKLVSIKGGQSVSARQLLNEANRMVRGKLLGALNIFHKMHVKRLKEMVGNQRVIFVSREEIIRIAGKPAAGMYARPPTWLMQQGGPGSEPVVLINSDYYNSRNDAKKAHIIVHELTHAATVFALDHNFRGTRTVVEQMMNRLRMQMIRDGRHEAVKEYGFTDAWEFIAEAFSNPRFQQYLKAYKVGDTLAKKIGPLSDRAPTWWDHFRATVQKAMGMLGLGNKAATYFDAVLDLHPDLMMSQQEMSRRADEDFFPGTDEPHSAEYGNRNPQHTLDFLPMMEDMDNRLRASWLKRFGSRLAQNSRGIWKAVSTEELKRRMAGYFDGDMDAAPVQEGSILQKLTNLRKKYAEPGMRVTARFANFMRTNHRAAWTMVDLMNRANAAGVDPSELLFQGNNRHISKKGLRHAHERAQWAELRKIFQSLPKEAQEIFKEIGGYFQNHQDQVVQKTVRNMIRAAIDGGVKLPEGMTAKEVEEWVLEGGIDQAPDKLHEREQEAIEALGPVGKNLRKSRELRRHKGYYSPMMRFGKLFTSGHKQLALPDGARRGDPKFEKSPDHDTFIFKTKKEMLKYLSETNERVAQRFTRLIDPRTGERVLDETDEKYDGVTLEKQYVVRAVNKVMEMHDNEAELNERKKAWEKEGFVMSNVAHLAKEMGNRNSEILPDHIRQIVNSIQQSGASDSVKEQQISAVTNAYVRNLAGNRTRHRGLKRRSIYGESRDMLEILRSNTHAMAGQLANLDLLPELDDVRKKTDKILKDMRYAATDKGLVALEEMVKEVRDRHDMAYKSANPGVFGRIINAIMTTSFMTHLASPMYSVINALQPFATTIPVLGGHFGNIATLKAWGNAMRDSGAISTMWSGIMETMKEGTHFTTHILGDTIRGGYNPKRSAAQNHYDRQRARLQNNPNIKNREAKLKALELQEELGFGSSSGTDAPDISEIGKNRAEVFLLRMAEVFRQLPEAIETVNRTVTSHMAIDLAMAKGMNEKEAVAFATTMVEKTQGGYDAANNPNWMQHPVLKAPTQFKKYGLMYGQLYYGAALDAAGVTANQTPESRRIARKVLINLTLSSAAFAGVAGLPAVELFRMGVTLMHGLGFFEDDWDEDENKIQDFFKSVFSLMVGEGWGSSAAEALIHGAPRLLGVDVSNRMGNDSLVLFGDPRKADRPNTESWILDQLWGAPGQMIADAASGIANGDITKMPWPKAVKDAIKAVEAATEQKKSASGKAYGPEATGWDIPAILQATLGVTPARQAREYESGGGRQYQQETKAKADRTKTMQQWLNADPSERALIWRDVIVPYNRGKTGKERIEMKDLQRNKKRRETEAKKEKANAG